MGSEKSGEGFAPRPSGWRTLRKPDGPDSGLRALAQSGIGPVSTNDNMLLFLALA